MAHSYESNENKQLAIYSYTESLKKDPTCIEAFNRLINSYLLKRTESNWIWLFVYFFRGIINEYIKLFKR